MKKQFIPSRSNNYKPHFWRQKNIAAVALTLAILFGFSTSLQYLTQKNPDLFASIIRSAIVDLTNDSRVGEKIGPLTINPTLQEAAQQKADDMATKGYFAHKSPEGFTPWYWFEQADYNFIYAGENLAVNFSDSEDVVRAWMNSEGHRANILNDHFTEIGIGLAKGIYKDRETIFVVQLFGTPAPGEFSAVTEEIVPDTTTDVGGASLEVVTKDDMFIAVENTAYTKAESQPLASHISYANAIDEILASPKSTLYTAYGIVGFLVFVALLLLIFIKPKHQYARGIAYGVLLFVFIVVLLYIVNEIIAPGILIE